MADPENTGVAVGILLLAGIEPGIRWGYFLPPGYTYNVTKNKVILRRLKSIGYWCDDVRRTTRFSVHQSNVQSDATSDWMVSVKSMMYDISSNTAHSINSSTFRQQVTSSSRSTTTLLTQCQCQSYQWVSCRAVKRQSRQSRGEVSRQEQYILVGWWNGLALVTHNGCRKQ